MVKLFYGKAVYYMGNTVSLDPRLSLVASLVRQGSRLADVGSDHGYLIGNLAFEGQIIGGTASDINPFPLESAKKYIASLGMEAKISCVLSDGLAGVDGELIDDIAIAGMGGDLISRIIENCPWLKDSKKSLILQPMTKVEVLRTQLYRLGFEIQKEQAVGFGGKVYTAMRAVYCGTPKEIGLLYSHTGALPLFPNSFTNDYYDQIIRYILKKAEGIKASDPELSREHFDLVSDIRRLKI